MVVPMSREAGEMADSQRNSEISDDSAKRMIRCSSVADFYSPPARAMMSSILRAFLDQLVITPTELLHSIKYQTRLDQSGALMHDAIERTGTLQARTYGESGPTRVRELADLVTNVMLYLRDAEQKRPAGTFKEGGINEYIRASKQQATGDQIGFRVNRGLAEHLTEFRSWALKIEHIIALGEEINREDFVYIDNLIGEALQCDVVQDNMFGRRISVEDRVDDLIELYLGVYPKRKKASSPTTQRLVALIKKHEMPETKNAIETVINNFLSSRDVLFSPELLTEFKGLRCHVWQAACRSKSNWGRTCGRGLRTPHFAAADRRGGDGLYSWYRQFGRPHVGFVRNLRTHHRGGEFKTHRRNYRSLFQRR